MANKIILTHTAGGPPTGEYVPKLGEPIYIAPTADFYNDIFRQFPLDVDKLHFGYTNIGAEVNPYPEVQHAIVVGDDGFTASELADPFAAALPFANPIQHIHSRYVESSYGQFTPKPQSGSAAMQGTGYFVKMQEIVFIWGQLPVWGGGVLTGLPYPAASNDYYGPGQTLTNKQFFPVFGSASGYNSVANMTIGVIQGNAIVANSKTISTTVSNGTTMTQGAYFSAWYRTDGSPYSGGAM